MFTDDTVLHFGKYKFRSLKRVPASYLLHYYKAPNGHPELIEYIEANLNKITFRANHGDRLPDFELKCEKILYYSEKHAKQALKRMASFNYKHKIPIRAYECPICGGWHLTSKTLEEYNREKSKLD